MGTDIYSSSGVLFTIEQVCRVFGKNNVATAAKKSLLEDEDFVSKISNLDLTIKNLEKPEDSEREEAFGNALETLKNCKKGSDFALWLDAFFRHQMAGEVAKYGSAYFQDEAILYECWNIICASADFDFPNMTLKVFGSGRNNGWDVPFGIPCFIFEEDDCFEKSLSDTGKVIAKIFGQKKLDVVEYTEVSY